MASEPPLLVTTAARRRSWLVKIASICLVSGVLLVPIAMTHDVLRERQNYQARATEEITTVWGREQRLIGPVLEVPYVCTKGTVAKSKLLNGQWISVDEPANVSAYAYFLPEELRVEGAADPEIRHRGIYDAVVYTTRLKVTGSVTVDFAAAGIEASRVEWEKARLVVGVSDLHGVRSVGPLRVAGRKDVPFEAVAAAEGTAFPLAATVGSNGPFATIGFDFEVVVQGSGSLKFAPVGKTTTAQLRSAWRDPSFTGAWLPTQRGPSGDGFVAEWTVASFSRGFPQSWSSRTVALSEIVRQIDAATFGVRFARSIDAYGVVERALKYGVLFIALVFAVFFLFEVVAELRIHPLQYAMVGAALCLFFLGFLALSEFWNVALAYSVAAGACTGLISFYSWTFLRSGVRTLVVLIGLSVTYAYLFFVLQSQDYALVTGTLALFGALAIAMYCTRRINWYALEANPSARAAS